MAANIPTFCRLCEPSCGLIATVEDNQLIKLEPDRNHPVTRGFACHKGLRLIDLHNDPDRLNYPMARLPDGELARLSWTDGLTQVAQAIRSIRDKYGDDAIASYSGNPLAFNSLAAPAIGSFMMKNRITRNFGSGTQDCANKFAASEAVFGTSTLHPVPDIEHTDFLLILGGNPRVSHMSFVSIADPMRALRDAKKRGARIVFVDPRENESIGGIGDLLQIKPDTDVYLLAALLNHLYDNNLIDVETINRHGDNIEGLVTFIKQYPPARVSDVVGLSVAEIETLAEDFAAAPSAAVYMSTGVNMGRQGTLGYWLVQMLSFVTGNLDKTGGNIYALGFYPAAGAGRVREGSPFSEGPFGEVRKVRGSLPANLLPDMIEMKDNPIRAMVVISGNPALSVGDSERMISALASLELLIVIDIYPTATADLAHYLLPATDLFEREDVNLCGLGLQSQAFVQYTDKVVEPTHDRQPEWWILGHLEKTLGFDSVFDDGAEPDLFGRLNHMMSRSNISTEQLKNEPSCTKVLPPMQAGRFYSDWLQTENKRVDCCPHLFGEALNRCEALFAELDMEPAGQLKLISRRTIYMMNSWMNNLASLMHQPYPTNPLYMHPEDARARNLGEGAEVSVSNANGRITTIVALDSTLRPGVVAMTHGWGNNSSAGLSVVRAHPGANANALLPSGPGSYEKLSNQAFMTGIPVEVEVA